MKRCTDLGKARKKLTRRFGSTEWVQRSEECAHFNGGSCELCRIYYDSDPESETGENTCLRECAESDADYLYIDAAAREMPVDVRFTSGCGAGGYILKKHVEELADALT